MPPEPGRVSEVAVPPVIGEQAVVLPALVLVLWAAVLGGPTPRLLPRLTIVRRTPKLAVLLWQAVSLSAVMAALLAAPVALLSHGDETSSGLVVRIGELGWLMPVLGVGTSVFIAGRLLLRAHIVGTALRAARRRHRQLVDLIAVPATMLASAPSEVRVLEHATPTAYCVPGGSRRVVLSQGTLAALADDEVAAVLAHERAHLAARHDLVLEFFTVWHSAVPRAVRSDRGLVEVQLLIELLADRTARRAVGALPLARALTTLSRAAHPDATLGIDSQALIRVQSLSAPAAPWWQPVLVLAAITVVALLPIAVAVTALT